MRSLLDSYRSDDSYETRAGRYCERVNHQTVALKVFITELLKSKKEAKAFLKNPDYAIWHNLEIHDQRRKFSDKRIPYFEKVANTKSSCFLRRVQSYLDAASRLYQFWHLNETTQQSRSALRKTIEEVILHEIRTKRDKVQKLEIVVDKIIELLQSKGNINTSSDEIKKALVVSENLINWIPLEPSQWGTGQKTVVTISDLHPAGETCLTSIQIDIPRRYYTKALCQEWFSLFLKDTDPNYPKWASYLMPWELNFWKDFLLNAFKKTYISSHKGLAKDQLTSREKLNVLNEEFISDVILYAFYGGNGEYSNESSASQENTAEERKILADIRKNFVDYSSKTLFSFLESSPSTFRNYPGLSNYREHVFLVFNEYGHLLHDNHSHRASVIVPYQIGNDVTSKNQEKSDDKVRHTALCIEQFAEQQFQLHRYKNKQAYFYFPTYLSPMLINTKLSYEASLHQLKAFTIDAIQNPDFLEGNDHACKVELRSAMVRQKQLNIYRTNTPVNNCRPGAGPFSKLAKDQDVKGLDYVLNRIHAWAEIRKSHPMSRKLAELSSLSWHELKGKPLDTYHFDINEVTTDENVFIFRLTIFYLKLHQPKLDDSAKPHQHHALMVSGAEELLLAKLDHFTLGSCRSGKDRRGLSLIYKDALSAYFCLTGDFPAADASKGGLNLLNYLVMELFVSGHQQRIAELNSVGCHGLKSLKAVLPRDIYQLID